MNMHVFDLILFYPCDYPETLKNWKRLVEVKLRWS